MILRLQSVEELELLQNRIKSRSKDIKVHENELRTNTGTDPEKGANAALQSGLHEIAGVASVKNTPRKPHKGPQATFEHQLLGRQLTQAQIAYREEFRFEPKRRWKADFFILRGRFIVEIVGGVWLKRGGHTGGQAQLDDMEKFNYAALLGYRTLQFSPQQVTDAEAIGFIERVLLAEPR